MKIQNFQSLPDWLKSNVFYRANLAQEYGSDSFNRPLTEVHPLDANLISSQKANGKHVLLLDLDQESFSIESTTAGHQHVYINADLSLEALKEIVDVLAKHGIVQAGIKKQLENSNCLTLRPPGVKKGNIEDQLGIEEYKDSKALNSFLDESEKTFVEGQPFSVYSQEVIDKFSSWKSWLTGNAGKDFDVVNKNNLKWSQGNKSVQIRITQGQIPSLVKILCIKFGIDNDNTITMLKEDDINDLHNFTYILVNDRKIAKCYSDFQQDMLLVDIREEFFHAKEGYDWPNWETVVQIMSNF